jgi:alpha-L-rhamnosidase
MGDGAVVEYPATHTALSAPGEPVPGDPRLLRRMLLNLAQGQLEDGRIKASSCTDRYDIHGYIEDYACIWVNALRQYYDQTGDLAFVRTVWPALNRQMAWFRAHRSPNGLIRAREFVIFDNPLAYKVCAGATLNAFVYRALNDSAYLATAQREVAAATAYHAEADALQAAFQKNLWDEAAGTYAGAVAETGISAAPTEHAAMIALLCGIVPTERRGSVGNWLRNCVTTADRLRMGYTYQFLFDALYGLDTPDADALVLSKIRTRWQSTVDSGRDTTAEDLYGGSTMHNFGASPAYFLGAFVLGVRSEGPASAKRLRIEPRPGDLASASGTVVTPQGPVPVAWTQVSGHLTLKTTIPVGATALLHLPMRGGATTLILDGKPAKAAVSGRYLAVTVGPGPHTATLTADAVILPGTKLSLATP